MNITQCGECGCNKTAEDRVPDLEAKVARLQADVKEARKHWRACEEGWNKVIKQAEGFLRERDRYKALAERRGRAGLFLWWFIGVADTGAIDHGDVVRRYGAAARAAIAATPEEEARP